MFPYVCKQTFRKVLEYYINLNTTTLGDFESCVRVYFKYSFKKSKCLGPLNPSIPQPFFLWYRNSNWLWIGKIAMTSKFWEMTPSSNIFDVVFFDKFSYRSKFDVNIITGFGIMKTSFLSYENVLRDWLEIRKPEIARSELCPLCGEWGELGIPNLVRTSLIKSYWMLQNARVTAFTVSELLREYQQGRWVVVKVPQPRLGLSLLTVIRLSRDMEFIL